jgi:hypothetical protein
VSTWKIEAVKADPSDVTTHQMLVSYLESSRAWRRLTKPARRVVEEMTRTASAVGHPNTMHALRRHGFVDWDRELEGWYLTEAGAAVAKWMVRDG